MKKIFLALALLVVFSGLSTAGVWQMRSHMPQGAADDLAVARYIDSLGYTCIMTVGGQRGGSALYDAYYYDPIANSWTYTPPLPQNLFGAAAASIGDTTYINGGYSQTTGGYYDSTYFFDKSMGYWFNFATMKMLSPRSNHGLVSIYGQYLYAVGGHTTGMADSSVERLDTQGGPPLYVKTMPQGRTNAVTAVALGQDVKPHIYVIGGMSHTGLLLNTVIEYDSSGIGGGTWTIKAATLPIPRWQAAGAVLNGKIYVMGGIVDLAGTVTRRVDIYDPAANTWSLGDSLPEKLCRAGAFGMNNAIYLFGGFNPGSGMQSDSVWQYRPFAPNPPPLAFPPQNALVNQQYQNFYWHPVPGCTGYRIQVTNDSTFGYISVADQPAADTSTLGLSIYLTPEGPFYWRVKSYNTVPDSSNWSTVRKVTLDTTQPVITYTCPYDGETSFALGGQITIAFSEPVQVGAAFNFSCSPDPGGWSTAWNASFDTVWLSHFDFNAGTTYTFQVTAASDMAGNGLGASAMPNPWGFMTVVNDVTPPTISVPNANNGALYAGSGITFTVNITDNISMGPVTLYWGPAGYSGYTSSNTMTPGAGASFECSIPGTDILPRGLQYQIVASDSSGNYSYYPNFSDYYIHSVHFNGQLTPNTNVPNDQWHMISIPADARNTNIFGQVSNELGAYDNTKWRLFIWGSGGYGEITGFSSGPINKLGQAYWLRHRMGGPANITFESPDSSYGNFNQSKTCSLALYPGWNDVGNPFLFNIDWTNVYNPALVAGPYFYDGTKWLDRDSVLNNSALPFKPYQGFSFRNDNTDTTYLEICPTAMNKSGKSPASKRPDGWQARVSVENQSGSDDNRFGLSSDASLQRDQYDYPEPPSGLTGTSGYFRLVGDQFCTDIRPELGDGQTWSFAVDCNGQTSMTITLPGRFPAGAECYLADLSRQVSVNVKDNNTYSFTPEPGEKVREFKIIAGQADYAKGVLGSSFAMPAVTLLAQNRPNPLKDNTAISYQLAATGPVKLAVYNVAGQLVKTLVNRPQMAGRYTVSWNGRDESGRQAATGVYFCRLTANGTSAARTMNLIK